MTQSIGSRRLFKGSLVFLLLLMVVVILENGGPAMKTILINDDMQDDVGSLEHTAEAKDKLGRHRRQRLELHSVSKRKVPKGPDPIHNRRAGNSHQPPGKKA